MRAVLPQLLALLLLPVAVIPSAAQVCRDIADPGHAEACLLDEVEALRLDIEESFERYVELLPSPEARDAQRGQDDWERYLDQECDAAGDRYGGGGLVLVEILSCQEWGARIRAFQLRLLTAARVGGSFVYDPTCFVPASDRVALSGWVRRRPVDGVSAVVVLELERPMCTDLGDGPQTVTEIQLVGVPPGLARRARRMLGVPIVVEGRLFLPHLPFHRTPLVLLAGGLETR